MPVKFFSSFLAWGQWYSSLKLTLQPRPLLPAASPEERETERQRPEVASYSEDGQRRAPPLHCVPVFWAKFRIKQACNLQFINLCCVELLPRRFLTVITLCDSEATPRYQRFPTRAPVTTTLPSRVVAGPAVSLGALCFIREATGSDKYGGTPSS